MTALFCWSNDATVGNICSDGSLVTGNFGAAHGRDGIALCDLVPAGKFRNGANRNWCRIHFAAWGTLRDRADLRTSGSARCRLASVPLNYITQAFHFDLRSAATLEINLPAPDAAVCPHAPVGSFPSELPCFDIRVRNAQRALVFEASVRAVCIDLDPEMHSFSNAAIARCFITPLLLRSLQAVRDAGMRATCVDCRCCGYPHVDLGSFATRPHRRHLCGNCGHQSVISKVSVISNPLVRLIGEFPGSKISCNVVALDDSIAPPRN